MTSFNIIWMTSFIETLVFWFTGFCFKTLESRGLWKLTSGSLRRLVSTRRHLYSSSFSSNSRDLLLLYSHVGSLWHFPDILPTEESWENARSDWLWHLRCRTNNSFGKFRKKVGTPGHERSWRSEVWKQLKSEKNTEQSSGLKTHR